MHWHTWFALMAWQQPRVLGQSCWKRQLAAEGQRWLLRQSPACGLRSVGKRPSKWFGLTHVRWRAPLERATWLRSLCVASSWLPTSPWSFWPFSCLAPSCTTPSGMSSQTAYDLSLASPPSPPGWAPPAWNHIWNGPITSTACWQCSIQPAPTGILPSQPAAATTGDLLAGPTSYCPAVVITGSAAPPPLPAPRKGPQCVACCFGGSPCPLI